MIIYNKNKMDKRIYFAGSIRGGRVDANLYQRIIAYINKTDVVLTEHIGMSDISLKAQGKTSDYEIYKQIGRASCRERVLCSV